MPPKIDSYLFELLSRRYRILEELPPNAEFDLSSITAIDQLVCALPTFDGKHRLTSLVDLIRCRQKLISFIAANTPPDEGEYDHEDEWAAASDLRFLHHRFQLGRRWHSSKIDWQTVSDVYHSQSPEQQQQINQLMTLLTDKTMDEILTPKGRWLRPQIINEMPSVLTVLGRDYVDQGGQKWLRADQFVKRIHVHAWVKSVEYDEEDDSESVVTKGYLVGTAGTLQGAIEIVAASLHQGTKRAMSMSSYDGLPFEVTISDGANATYNGPTILNAEVEKDCEPQPGDDEKVMAYTKPIWRLPYTASECQAAKIKLADLRSDHAEESRADNYSTCRDITARMQEIRSRFPAKGFEAEVISTALRETLRALQYDEGLSTLLEQDLGL
jgi:hypothetical protein